MKSGEFRVDSAPGRAPVLVISGEHDLDTAPELRRRVDELLRGDAVVIDLSDATFIDSSILGVLLEARRRADEAGVGFALAMEDGAVAVSRVLRITGLDSQLPVHDSLDSALAAASGSRVA